MKVNGYDYTNVNKENINLLCMIMFDEKELEVEDEDGKYTIENPYYEEEK